MPIKDPATGAIKTKTLEVEGPAAFLETTTRLSINPENASRCFEIYLDESGAQTERVQTAQRLSKTPEGMRRRARSHAVERLHQNAQRLLAPVGVVIRYAPLLTFPASWLRTRRDNLRLLNLIEAVAFLHQHQRPKLQDGGTDYVEATVEDYAIAYALAASVFGLGLDELKKPVREVLSVVEQKLTELAQTRGTQLGAVGFTRREVRGWSGLPNHQVKLIMRELEDLELVEVERSMRGSRHTYKLIVDTEKKRAPLSGLLTPVELHNRIADAETKAQPAAVRKVEQSGKNGRSTHFPAKSRVSAGG